MSDDLARLKARAIEHIDAQAAELDQLALRIHAKPEIAYEEHAAVALLTDYAVKHGASVSSPVGGLETAFISDSGEGGALVAILGEYDALPGVGHACGHNLMGTAAVGAYLAVRQVFKGSGRIRLIGCPAEERGSGKVALLAAGVFDGVDAALMFHPGDRDEIDPLMLAMVTLDVEFRGQAAHASAEPHAGVNALDALLSSFASIAALRQLMRSDSRIHGIITDGGQAANIIPERTAARLMVRSPDNSYLSDLCSRVLSCFQGAAQATGCELRFEWSDTCERVTTNGPLIELFAANALALGRTLNPRQPDDTHGSTDMGNVTSAVPGIHPFLAIADFPTPGHSHAFASAAATARALDTMRLAAKALAMTALDLFSDPALVPRAHQALRER